jgi:hypothetical protein
VKITPQLAEALVSLRGNRDFKTFLEGLKEHEEEERQRCVDGEGAIQLRASGGAKALKYWRDAFDSAPADLEKFKKQIQQQVK